MTRYPSSALAARSACPRTRWRASSSATRRILRDVGRRPKGTGSIWKGPKGWIAQLELGVVDGRRVRRRFSGRTKAEVSKRLETARRSLSDGVLAPERLTVGTFLSQWLREIDVRPKTLAGYESIVRTGLKPHLGTIKLAELTVADVEGYLRRRKDLRALTRHHHLAALRAALKHAARRGLLARNVASLARAPRVRKTPIRPMTGEEARTLLAGGSALYRVALATGLRQGELLGLRWSDVDFDGGSVTVRKTLHRRGGEYFLDDPKTAESQDSVPLLAGSLAALKEHRRSQAADRLAAGPGWIDNDLVFTTANGAPLYGSDVTRQFQAALTAAGLPRYRFHDLRHSTASFLIEAGVPIEVVSRILRHSTIKLTMDTYGFLRNETKRRAIERLEGVLG